MAVFATGGRPLAYLGPRSDHRYALERLLATAGVPLVCLDDSLAAGVYRRAGLFGRLMGRAARALHQALGRADSLHLDRVVSQLDGSETACVLAYWGTGPLGDVIALKRRRPRLKVILNVLCHPLSLTRFGVSMQNRLMRRAAGLLDGIIYSSRVMQDYFERHVLSNPLPSMVLPPYLPADTHPADQFALYDPVPNLIFLGRMDWAKAQPSDNVGGFIDALLDSGVHVHHHTTAEFVRPHPHRHTFAYQPLREVTRFCTQFQATLVAYNTAACGEDIRFRVTVPDRLVAGVAAGLPVFLPRTGYDACWEYLERYPAAIPFDTAADIHRALSDASRMCELRSLAWESRSSYTAESHLGTLLGFVADVTGAPAGRTRVFGASLESPGGRDSR